MRAEPAPSVNRAFYGGDVQVMQVCCEPGMEPVYATKGASGFDLKCAEDVVLDWLDNPWQAVRTGCRFSIPEGYEIQIRPRSGLATKGIVIMNSPGTIDADYRGEVKILMKLGRENKNGKISFLKGDRIAQGVLVPVSKALFHFVDDLDNTARGFGGFGSTGV